MWSKQPKGQQQQDLEGHGDVGKQLLDCEHWQTKKQSVNKSVILMTKIKPKTINV